MLETAFACGKHRLKAPVKNRPKKESARHAALNIPDFAAGSVSPLRSLVRIGNLHLNQRRATVGSIASFPPLRKYGVPRRPMLFCPIMYNQRSPERVVPFNELPCVRGRLRLNADCGKPPYASWT
jgi:hypothetical protein